MRKFYLILSLLFATFISASAYDFAVANEDGMTIYYNITGEGTASVTFPNKDFTGAEYVGDIVIPEQVTNEGVTYTVTAIADWAFYLCSNITSVTLPNTVTSIGGFVFEGCKGMTAITVGDAVTSVGERAFRDCSSLTAIEFTDALTYVGDYSFYGSVKLATATLGQSVYYVGEGAFADCKELTSMLFPATIDSIGNSAFMNCTALEEVTVLDTDPDDIWLGEMDPFYNANVGRACTLYVPQGTKALYEDAAVWKYFAYIEEINEDDSVEAILKDNGKAAYYDIKGIRTEEPQPGNIYIKVVDGIATKVVYSEK